MHWFFVIHEIIFSAPAQSRRHLPQRRRNSWPAGRTSAGSWTKHRGGSCCTPAGRPVSTEPMPATLGRALETKRVSDVRSCTCQKASPVSSPMNRSPIQGRQKSRNSLTRCTPRMAAQRGLSASRWRLSVLRVSAAPASFPAARPSGPCRAENAAASGPDAAPPAGRRER